MHFHAIIQRTCQHAHDVGPCSGICSALNQTHMGAQIRACKPTNAQTNEKGVGRKYHFRLEYIHYCGAHLGRTRNMKSFSSIHKQQHPLCPSPRRRGGNKHGPQMKPWDFIGISLEIFESGSFLPFVVHFPVPTLQSSWTNSPHSEHSSMLSPSKLPQTPQ